MAPPNAETAIRTPKRPFRNPTAIRAPAGSTQRQRTGIRFENPDRHPKRHGYKTTGSIDWAHVPGPVQARGHASGVHTRGSGRCGFGPSGSAPKMRGSTRAGPTVRSRAHDLTWAHVPGPGPGPVQVRGCRCGGAHPGTHSGERMARVRPADGPIRSGCSTMAG